MNVGPMASDSVDNDEVDVGHYQPYANTDSLSA